MSNGDGSRDKFYTPIQEAGWERWTHEDHLINHRLTWLGATQTILFAAQGIVVQQLAVYEKDKADFLSNCPIPAAQNIQLYLNLLDRFRLLLPWVGLVSSFLIYSSVIAATVAMIRIKKFYELPDYGVSLLTSVGGWTSSVGLSALFMFAWSRVLQCGLVSGACIVLYVITAIYWIYEFNREHQKKLIKKLWSGSIDQ